MTRRRKRKLGPWETSHRPFTLRLDPEQREKVEGLRKTKSLQKVLEDGLLRQEQDAFAYERGYSAGRERGRAEVYGRFQMPCVGCGELVDIDLLGHPDLVRALGTVLHSRCDRCETHRVPQW